MLKPAQRNTIPPLVKKEAHSRSRKRRSPLMLAGPLLLAMLAGVLSSCTTTGEGANPFSSAKAKDELDQTARIPSAAGAARFDTPPLYRVRGGRGANLIFLGTVHLGPKGGWSLSPEATSAIENASAIVMELDERKVTEEAVSNFIANTIMFEPPTTLVSVLRPETAKLLEEMNDTVTAMGMPSHLRKYMKPWFVSVGLIESATNATGYSGESSVEKIVMATLDGRELMALETFEEQMRIFDDLPLALQDLILFDTLARLDETEEGIAMLMEAWRTSDLNALQEIAREGSEELPELEPFYVRLLDDRNRQWRADLVPLLEDPKRRNQTILVAVGALHLAGPGSVLSLVEEAGYSVTEISQTRLKP